MTNKRDPDTFTALLDAFVESPRVGRALRKAGITPMTFLRWMRLSEKNDPSMIVTYAGVTQPLHLAVADSKAIALATLEGEFMADQTHGYHVDVIHHGEPQWVDDEALIRLGWDFCRDTLGLSDMKKRDAIGNRIPLKQWVPPTTEGRLGILRPRHPDYRDQRHISVSGSVGLGVRVIGTPRNAPVPVEVIGDAVVNAITHEETIDVSDTVDMSDLIGDDEVALPVHPPADERAEVRKSEAVAASAPLEDTIARLSKKPMSPLLQDALQRLRAKQAATKDGKAPHVRMPPASARVEPDRDGPV